MTHLDRALLKIQAELQKDIARAIEISKQFGLIELFHILYSLHWTRLLDKLPAAQSIKKDLLNLYSSTLEDSYKYQISLVATFGNWSLRKTKEGQLLAVDNSLINFFTRHCNYINSKYEIETIIELFDIEVSGERDRYIKMDMGKVNENPEVKKLLDYFLRIDIDNSIRKDSKKSKDNIINSFRNEYQIADDLFKAEFDISVDEYCYLISTILDKITAIIEAKAPDYEYLENENVDISSFQTFLNFSLCFLHNKEKLYSEFNSRFHKALDRLIFDPSKFDQTQLRYHLLTRQPILAHGGSLVISPELLLDSLFINVHYSMIESEALGHEYVARQASAFLNRIKAVAAKAGFAEVEREKDLYEGKQQIGDIDLVLKKNDEYLLIEAKNHALPMDVYFKDIAKTKQHLEYLQNSWEAKVKRRVEHLKSHHSDYGISANYNYIVVSRYPEIISHYSDLFIVSIHEFEIWLLKYQHIQNFGEFYRRYYSEFEKIYTAEDIKRMGDDGLTLLSFSVPEK